MNINIEQTEDSIALAKEMTSSNKQTAASARQLFAETVQMAIAAEFQKVDTAGLVYKDVLLGPDARNYYAPADMFATADDEVITITSTPSAGSLATNEIKTPDQEIGIQLLKLDSAVSVDIKYVQDNRFDVVSRIIQKCLTEVLHKTEIHAWSTFLSAVGTCKSAVKGVKKSHVARSNATNVVTLADLNSMLTAFRRLQQAKLAGTSVMSHKRPTHLIMSPEIMEQFRAMAFQPINTKGANNVAGTNTSGTVALPDEDRAKIFSGAGTPEFFNMLMVELDELGLDCDFNVLFDEVTGTNEIHKIGATSGGSAFDKSADELIIAVDQTRDFAHRPIASEGDVRFFLSDDDQFPTRMEKMGWYGWVREGRFISDVRPTFGLVV